MKRSPGRPQLDEDDPSVDVHVKMPSRQYDDAYQIAQLKRVTVPEVLRLALRELTSKKT